MFPICRGLGSARDTVHSGITARADRSGRTGGTGRTYTARSGTGRIRAARFVTYAIALAIVVVAVAIVVALSVEEIEKHIDLLLCLFFLKVAVA